MGREEWRRKHHHREEVLFAYSVRMRCWRSLCGWWVWLELVLSVGLGADGGSHLRPGHGEGFASEGEELELVVPIRG